MKIPYPVNKEKYFNGNFNESNYGYALPLKKELFNYFSIKDVMSILPNGEKFFELRKQAGDSVEAILRIPIQKKEYIKFSRMYFLNQYQEHTQEPDLDENKGVIVEYLFGMAIYPFLKTGNDATADYRIMLIDCDTLDIRTKSNKYAMQFYKENAPTDKDKIEEPKIYTRGRSDKNAGELATSIYQVLNKEFDFIEIKPNAYAKGLIIPRMKTYGNGPDKFTFAIDFGTTNTHIEYKINERDPQPFEITETDMQVGCLHNNNKETLDLLKRAQSVFGFGIKMLTELMPKEFLPEKIGGGNNDYKFPMRTIIGEDRKLAKNSSTFTLADFNIPFVYEKFVMPPNSFITSNLKWTNFSHTDLDKKRVYSFIEKLVMLIRNKVLLNNGNLEDTKIIWFYPSSMDENRRSELDRTWTDLVNRKISPNSNPIKLSESIAPFYYLKKRKNILAFDKPVASIDIGGGTTDIVIFVNNVPIHLTSFRFASNAIFGDGYGSSIDNNAYVNKYKPIIEEILAAEEDVNELRDVMKQISERKLTSEIITYFFSLENNRSVKENNIELSFSQLLRSDEQSKIIFLFFYAAIIYHLAHLMQALKLPVPRFITFSGTGSKVLNIIDNNLDLKNLTAYTNVIFSDVYEKNIKGIELMQSPEPKEITCKGGLFCDEDLEDIDNIKTILVGDNEDTILPNKLAEKNIKYKGLNNNNTILNSVIKEVDSFIDSFFRWHNTFNYYNKFGASPRDFDIIKARMKEDLKNFLKAGVDRKLKEVNDNIDITLEEPLFFYPLIGILNKISQNIYSIPTSTN